MFTGLTLGAAALKVGGKVWGAVVDFASTAIGAGLICGLIGLGVGNMHGHHKEKIKWVAKWDAAEKKAEADRKQRDADIKAEMEANANVRIERLTALASELEQKVQKNEAERALAGSGIGPCDLLTSDDERRLLDLQRGKDAKPQARSGLARRLRTGITGGPRP